MGLSSSVVLPRPTERVIHCVERLELTNEELGKMFKIFNKADTAHKGALDLQMVYAHLGESKSIFGDSVFELIGVKNFERIVFGEWLQAVVTYCLFEEEEILKFCFFVLDREKNGMVEVDELKMLVNMLYNVDPAKGPTGNARVALQKLPVQADGKVEFWEFQALHNAFPSLLFPAFRLQVKMMQRILGEKWWAERKRAIQDELDGRRHLQNERRLAEGKRRERMRQRRIRRKMGTVKYYLFPCGRDSYDKILPKAPEEPPEKILTEEEARRLEAERKADIRKMMEMKLQNPETEEYKRFLAKKKAAAEARAQAMQDEAFGRQNEFADAEKLEARGGGRAKREGASNARRIRQEGRRQRRRQS